MNVVNDVGENGRLPTQDEKWIGCRALGPQHPDYKAVSADVPRSSPAYRLWIAFRPAIAFMSWGPENMVGIAGTNANRRLSTSRRLGVVGQLVSSYGTLLMIRPEWAGRGPWRAGKDTIHCKEGRLVGVWWS